jgi:tRNA-2-methylthio-N6-dimethylallyladenosine synthase
VEAGVVEITLLGQTVNHYRFEHDASVVVDGIEQPQKGRSFTGGHRRDPVDGGQITTFARLLERIHNEVPELARLRFVTSYPRDFGDDILEVMRDCPRICRYLHVPVQSASNRILELMNRGYTIEEYKEFIERVRTYLPDATIASDIIVGFPTETESDFALTADLLRWARFKNCFVFKYSERPGTPAVGRLVDDVPDSIKRARNNELLVIQSAISTSIHAEYIGRRVDVFVEGLSARQSRKMGSVHGHGHGTIGLTIGGASIGASEGATATMATEEVVQLSGRTDGDLITVFDVPGAEADAFIGRIVPVLVEEAHSLTLRGRLVGAL